MNNFDRAEAAWEARQDAAMEARYEADEIKQEVLDSLEALEVLKHLDGMIDMPSIFFNQIAMMIEDQGKYGK